MTAMDTSPKSTNGSLLDLNWTAGMLPVVNGANGSKAVTNPTKPNTCQPPSPYPPLTNSKHPNGSACPFSITSTLCSPG